MYHIAFDPGFGNGKIALIVDGELRTIVVSAIVGMGNTNIGRLGIGDVGRQRRRRLPDQVTFGGVGYLVGEGTERYANPMQGLDFLRLRDGPDVRALFYDCVYHALGAGEHEASMVVGLPVEVMANERQADVTSRDLRDWMINSHQFSVNDDDVSLVVEDVKLIAQPVGAFFAWGMDDDGQWMQGENALDASIGVLDIGFNTLDLFAMEGAEIAARYTDGDTLGMRRAAEYVIQAVDNAYDKSISIYQANTLIQSSNPILHTPQGQVDLRPLVAQALSRVASGILTFVRQPDKWGDGRQFDYLLFAGGGAEALREQLNDQFPRGYVLPQAVAANAIGMARYARRVYGCK
ncbi:MAG: ParM/StbA family protein [Chloroflexi bacterium]|nr:ParM/StbA family protein [Chloroflexota bacterium]